MNPENAGDNEQHPLLPSGEWKGFYVYARESEKHQMQITMEFKQNKIQAVGNDDVGEFSFSGAYDLKELTCHFTKYYKTHTVEYRGNIDENGIWGKWVIPYNKSWGIDEELYKIILSQEAARTSGGFHIWPPKMKLLSRKLRSKSRRKKKCTSL